jgi:ketosteroid isomerase-like protein
MPKRTVKRLCWELESEKLQLTPAELRRMHKVRMARSRAALAKLAQASQADDLFYCLAPAALGAYYLGDFVQAQTLAQQAIAASQDYTSNWNYSNAIHTGHTVLGLVALQNGQMGLALEHLQMSGDVKGSPQLGSFGPHMLLAKELLIHGQAVHVAAYFEQCRKFWNMGQVWLDVWHKKISKGQVPHFVMHL